MNVGTRAEILAELEESGKDRAVQGNAVKAAEYARAMNEVQQGADTVRIRHSVWLVHDGDGSPSDGEIASAAAYPLDAVAR